MNGALKLPSRHFRYDPAYQASAVAKAWSMESNEG